MIPLFAHIQGKFLDGCSIATKDEDRILPTSVSSGSHKSAWHMVGDIYIYNFIYYIFKIYIYF